MQNIVALFVGLLFGIGLLLSGMTNPAKVLGFLDLAGQWDPSLALVMGGAIAIAAPAFAWIKRRPRSMLGAPVALPAAATVNIRLILGSLVFGVGWGLAGFCPGPALVSAATGQPGAWIFVAAMLAGMAIFSIIERLLAQTSTSRNDMTAGRPG